MSQKHYFEGLNALRFFAAAIVVFYHIRINLTRLNLPQLPDFPFFFKGDEAVLFFFTLSGFLITYLLLHEKQSTHTISIKKFYMRRILRIWPLYYLIVIIGLVGIFMVFPMLGIGNKQTEFSLMVGIFSYVFFLPNLIYSLYHVSGFIGITWSIGVEEQYYLFWAPLVKKYFNSLLILIIVVFVITSGISIANSYNAFGLTDGWRKFVKTMHFNYMAIGGLAAYYYYYKKDWLMNLKPFTNKLIQLFFVFLIAVFFLLKTSIIPKFVITLILPFLFAWLILNISENRKYRIFTIKSPVLNWLGKISYGIYMYHYLCIFFVSFIFLKLPFEELPRYMFLILYISSVWFLTIGISYISYEYFEKQFLKLKHRWE